MDYEAIEAMVDAPFQKVPSTALLSIDPAIRLLFLSFSNLNVYCCALRRSNPTPAPWTWMSLAETRKGAKLSPICHFDNATLRPFESHQLNCSYFFVSLVVSESPLLILMEMHHLSPDHPGNTAGLILGNDMKADATVALDRAPLVARGITATMVITPRIIATIETIETGITGTTGTAEVIVVATLVNVTLAGAGAPEATGMF